MTKKLAPATFIVTMAGAEPKWHLQVPMRNCPGYVRSLSILVTAHIATLHKTFCAVSLCSNLCRLLVQDDLCSDPCSNPASMIKKIAPAAFIISMAGAQPKWHLQVPI